MIKILNIIIIIVVVIVVWSLDRVVQQDMIGSLIIIAYWNPFKVLSFMCWKIHFLFNCDN